MNPPATLSSRLVPGLALLLVAALFRCDSGGPETQLGGTWTLSGVTTLASQPTDGPVGSTLRFRRDGTYGLSSVNGCGGDYVVREERIWFVTGACTLIGAPVEHDLAQMLFLGGDTPSYGFDERGDLVLDVYVTQPVADPDFPTFLRFRFERD